MTYKDMTFCDNWCNTEDCERNYKHIKDAQQEGGFLKQNPWMPVAFFVDKPLDCNKWTPKNDQNN